MTTRDASTPTSSNESATPTASATAKSAGKTLGAGKSAGNLYVQAIRWATDRLNHPRGTNQPGVIAFIHPNSVCNATSLAGMRAALRDEFTDIYVVNLLGDAMKSGDEGRREGNQVIFGIEIRETSEVRKGTGSRNGVQITVLVRNPHKDQNEPAKLHYAQVPEYSTLQQKFDWLEQLGDITSDAFETVQVNDTHDWVNITDGTFETMLPVCAISAKRFETRGDTAVKVSRLGRPRTATRTSTRSLARRPHRQDEMLIDTYEDARELHHDLGLSFDECTANVRPGGHQMDRHPQAVVEEWLEEISFDETRIREVLYRPFHQTLALRRPPHPLQRQNGLCHVLGR